MTEKFAVRNNFSMGLHECFDLYSIHKVFSQRQFHLYSRGDQFFSYKDFKTIYAQGTSAKLENNLR